MLIMNKSKMLWIGAAIGILGAGFFSFDYDQYTGWAEERVDPYTLKAVCKKTTFVGLFGKLHMKDGPPLPNSECREAVNYFLTEKPKEGCSIDAELLTATCKEAYAHPLY